MFPELPVMRALQRPQLRPARILPLMVIVIAITAVAFAHVWAAAFQELGLKFLPKADRNFSYFCLIAQYLGLAVLGSFTIAGGLDRDRDSGILSFHRLTPMSPDAITIGYILGLGSTALLVWAAFAVFGLMGVIMGGISLVNYLIVTVLALLSGFFFHLLTMLISLSFPQRGAARFFYTAAVSLLPLVVAWIPFDISFLTPLPAAMMRFDSVEYSSYYSSMEPFTLLGVKMYPLVYTLLLLLAFGSQIYLAVRRKVRLPEAPELSKAGALLLFSTLILLFAGRSLDYLSGTGSTIADISLPVFFGLAVMLSIVIIPGRLHFRRYFIRRYQGERSGSSWSDNASVLPVSLIMAGLSILFYLVLLFAENEKLPSGAVTAIVVRSVSMISVLVFMVFLFEWSRLRLRRNSDWVAGTIVALWWILPLLIAGSLSMNDDPVSAAYALGISPLPMLFASPDMLKDMEGYFYQSFYYMSPSITLTFTILAMFFGLRARRRMAAEVALRRDIG